MSLLRDEIYSASSFEGSDNLGHGGPPGRPKHTRLLLRSKTFNPPWIRTSLALSTIGPEFALSASCGDGNVGRGSDRN